MIRPPMEYTWRERLFAVFASFVVIAALMTALSASGTGGGADEGRGRVREVPMETLRRKIEMKQLSDHPAEYAEPVTTEE